MPSAPAKLAPIAAQAAAISSSAWNVEIRQMLQSRQRMQQRRRRRDRIGCKQDFQSCQFRAIGKPPGQRFGAGHGPIQTRCECPRARHESPEDHPAARRFRPSRGRRSWPQCWRRQYPALAANLPVNHACVALRWNGRTTNTQNPAPTCFCSEGLLFATRRSL